MISIKEGVDVRGLHPKIWEAIYLVDGLLNPRNIDTVITSGLEGKHSYGSLHYSGLAVDIRKRTILHADEMFSLIKELLPDAYDCVNEKTHYHIEYQPKTLEEVSI